MENGRKIIENAKKLVEKLKLKVEKNQIAITALYKTMMGDQVCIEVLINYEVYPSLCSYIFRSILLLSLFYLSLYRPFFIASYTFKNPSHIFF